MVASATTDVKAADGVTEINNKNIIKMNCFKDIIADNEFFYDLPDCISEAAGYTDNIQRSCEITNGVLVFESCNATEVNNKYKFHLTINETNFDFEVEIYSDTVDAGGLVDGLNGILVRSGYAGERRFCNVNGEVLDFGIAFISPEKEQELASKGFIWREY
jgi:hypothetical protein